MNNKPGIDMDAFTRIWRDDDGPDLEELIARIHRAGRWSGTKRLFEYIISLSGLAAAAWLFLLDHPVLGFATALFAGMGLLLTWRTHQRDRHIQQAPVLPALLSAIQLTKAQHETVRNSLWLVAGALIFLSVILMLTLADLPVPAVRLELLLTAVCAALLFITVNLIGLILTLKRTSERLQKLRSIQSELSEEEHDDSQ